MGAEGARFLSGVQGHALPRNFIFLRSLKRYFFHFQAGLLIVLKPHIGNFYVR